MNRAQTTQKYLSVARIEGVADSAVNGSNDGIVAESGASSRWAAWYQASPAIPAKRRITEKPVHNRRLPAGRLPTRSSGGQLFV